MAPPVQLTRTHRMLIGVVVAGAVVIAAIGFAGSYAAVQDLAVKKGFGNFSYFFPIGIDAGICVLLALDLLLTWIRIPFPLLRQTAWLLTAATIAFNGAAAWPDPLGVGMHSVIPMLFVVAVEAARHAVGRIADITADKHMEGVRITRWLLSPLPTFLLWRRMKLWELRSYEQVIKLEQERLVYQARLRSRYGRAWRRKAPVESLMPLRLARYGVPLAETAAAGLAAAGVETSLLPSVSLERDIQGQPPPEAVGSGAPELRTASSRTAQEPGLKASEPAPTDAQSEHADDEWGAFYRSAAAQFAVVHGHSPNAAELTGFLYEHHAVADDQGRPLPADVVAPYLELQQAAFSPQTAGAVGGDLHGAGVGEKARVHSSGGGSSRTAVQMRIPAPAGPQLEPEMATTENSRQGAVGADEGSITGELTGLERVEFHYRQLPPQTQERSAKSLAPELAALCGYTEGTVRKYIGEIRRKASA